MWFWWIFSVLILASAIIFALSVFFGNYKIAPVKKEFRSKINDIITPNIPSAKNQVISSLKLKLQAVESNSIIYYNELKKLQQRIQALEKGKTKAVYEEENWEELYYQKHEEKERLENELDATSQKLELTENDLNELKIKEAEWRNKFRDLELKLNESHSLQIKFSDLQKELRGALARETELQQELELQNKVFKDFELLQKQHVGMQIEAEELKSRIKEINNRDILLEQKINRLTEQESNFEIAEYEKIEIRKTVEEIVLENEALAAKLHDLQEKLGIEKYA